MKEAVAKKHLQKMLRDFTVGSVLFLLADLFREDAEEARQQDDSQAYERLKSVEAALLVVGMGIDAACPR